MCTFSQTSSQGSDPGTTAGLNFMMGAGKSIGGWMTSRSNAKAHNRALLKNYKYDIAQWNNKYDRDVIGWKNDNIDNSLKVEGEWQQSMERLADSDLQIYDYLPKDKNLFEEVSQKFNLQTNINLVEVKVPQDDELIKQRFIECIETCLEKWTPRKRFTLYKVEQKKKIENYKKNRKDKDSE